jgi:phosphoglycolate phosphatase-like HAD superfamily hydrolase
MQGDQKIETQSNDLLAAWTDTPKATIENWVKEVTDSSSKNFIPVKDRIAVFDNDGTLWPEQPVPTQAIFAIDNLKALAATHPEFLKDPVLKGVINNNMDPLKKAGMAGLMKLIYASHTNQTEEQFNNSVRAWIDTAKDKKFGKLYKDVVYQPMVQLLDYLRANDFKTFIVSGGGADFMRVWSEEVYKIPPYQVIGSYGDLSFDTTENKAVIMKTTGDIFADDKAGKPEAIHRFIGQIPVFCGGNSDGDQAMMQYTSSSAYKTMCVLLHHTDSIREYKYDLHTISGHLEVALDEAKQKGWLVVDMQKDFKKIFSFD